MSRLTQGDICELGRVLMQGSFSVWISHKRGATRVKELARFKPMQRHFFLYEKALLLCKRREEHADSSVRTSSYSFKHCLKVSVWNTGAGNNAVTNTSDTKTVELDSAVYCIEKNPT